jgi:hypothetical protein
LNNKFRFVAIFERLLRLKLFLGLRWNGIFGTKYLLFWRNVLGGTAVGGRWQRRFSEKVCAA